MLYHLRSTDSGHDATNVVMGVRFSQVVPIRIARIEAITADS